MARKPGCYLCWMLEPSEREKLLAQIPAEYPRVVAEHITYLYGVPVQSRLPTATRGFIIGEIMDRGVQALVVEIDGSDRRPDGERYHITWSLDWDRYPAESKDLVKRGFWPFENPIEIQLIPSKVML